MPTTPVFGTQVIGQTEKALNAILDRELTGTGLTEPQWVTLSLTVAGGGAVDRDELAGRVAGALKVSDAQAQARITELARAQLVEAPDSEGSLVELTDAGRQVFAQVRAVVNEITKRLWGDLPAGDLETAAGVLGTVLARANAELGAA